jgi:hypothetical protein
VADNFSQTTARRATGHSGLARTNARRDPAFTRDRQIDRAVPEALFGIARLVRAAEHDFNVRMNTLEARRLYTAKHRLACAI